MLSIHGRRPDGFHELTSLMVALNFGDTLTVRVSKSGEDLLSCSSSSVPLGSKNIVLKAASAFRSRLVRPVYFEFDLEKRIPVGAGFGGGSSNAIAALSGMNELLGHPLDEPALYQLAASLGSDCPFFIHAKPAWAYGRGERIELLETSLAEKIVGKPLALFKPYFSIDTSWAYQRLAANPEKNYQKTSANTSNLESAIKNDTWSSFLSNSFEAPVGEKFVALPILLNQLRKAGVICMMSGSGSGCFALLKDKTESEKVREIVLAAFGEKAFWVETFIC